MNQEQDPFDSKSQKSLSIQDIPNTFVASFIYELPFGKGKIAPQLPQSRCSLA